jgi:predicted nucleic acid-binding protein
VITKHGRPVAELGPVTVRDPQGERCCRCAAVGLVRRHDLSLYEASYIDLARQRGLPLATLDAKLRKACVAVIPCLD